MLMKILKALAIILVVLVIIVAAQPAKFRITRQAAISASPAAVAEFTFKPEGNQTVVTWTMSGKNKFMGKAMSLIMNCDKMAGGQFEKGLAQLKSVVEAAPKQ